MRRWPVAVAALVLGLLSVQAAFAGAAEPIPTPSPIASPSPSPSASPRPSPSASPSPLPSPSPSPDPNRALYDRLRSRLDGDLALTLAAGERLNATLESGRAREADLSAKIDASATLISDLTDQVAQLDDQISTTQDGIDSERAAVAALARAMYRRPTSWLVLLARAGNLHEALVEAAGLVGAGQRAHSVETRLQADLARLNSERSARQADLDRETAAKQALDASIEQLQTLLGSQEDIAAQLLDLETQLQDAMAGLEDQSPEAAAELAALLEAQQSSLSRAAMDLAWGQAQIGSGRLQLKGLLPAGNGPADLKLAWPEPGAPLSQPFGPSDLLLEPPLGPFPHFHTGDDFAAPEGTPVLAAADGVVVAAASGKVGYGNFVVLAHGGGVETLYGHLKEFTVSVGDRVKQGQPIGREGSSGFSTGPHLHFEVRLNGQLLDPMLYLPAPVKK